MKHGWRLNGVLITLVVMGLGGSVVWFLSLDTLMHWGGWGLTTLTAWWPGLPRVDGLEELGLLVMLGCVLALGGGWAWRARQVHTQQHRETALAQAIVQARQELEHETDVLLHSVIKARISEIQQRVRSIQPLVPDPQSALGMHLTRLDDTLAAFRDETIHLYDRSTQRSGVSGSLLPGQLEQTARRQQHLVQELGGRCTLTRAGVAPAHLPAAVEGILELALCNAVTNAREHAQARQIRIHLAYGLTDITVQVQDDGRGFDGQVRRGRRGRGLRDVQQAVAAVGGQLTVQSAPHQGTTVTVVVPLPRPQLGWASVGRASSAADPVPAMPVPPTAPATVALPIIDAPRAGEPTRPPWQVEPPQEVPS